MVDLQIPPTDVRLSHHIGRGGMGKVFLGDWRGTPVAVKVLGRKRHSQADLEQQFSREFSVLASLRHPCICTSERALESCTLRSHECDSLVSAP